MKKSGKIMAVCFSLAAIAAAAGIVYLSANESEKKYACIYQDGNLIHKINLSDVEKPYTVTVGTNVILVEKGQVSMSDADCPDGLCIKQGAITGDARPIVCLPNNVVVKLTNDEKDIDGVSGN